MKIKKTLYIQAEKYCFDNEFVVQVNCFKNKTDKNCVVFDITEHVLELEIPDIDENKLNVEHIEQLKQMKLKVMAENEIRLQKIDDDIQKLMSIESK